MITETLAAPAPPVLKLLAHDLRWQALLALARSDYRVHELVALLRQPANLISYHLKRLEAARLVTERRSAADRRDIYYSLDLDRLRTLYFAGGDALHPALSRPAGAEQAAPPESGAPPTRVLFLCTHNSARSQMAEGIMRFLGGPAVAVFSAGTEPSRVHPDAIAAMSDLGIDIREQTSKHLNEFLGQRFDYVITVCDRTRESCPLFPGDPVRIHWSFPDPAAVEGEEARRAAFRRTAQELMNRIRILLTLIEKERRAGSAAAGA